MELSSNNPHASFSRLAGAKCLVTGGAGFIGSQIVDALLDAGAVVRVLDNLSTGFRQNLEHLSAEANVELVEGDAADAKAVHYAVDSIDYVFHLAAMASVPRSMREPDLCHSWCTSSTVELLTQGQRAGVKRMVLASTSAAYGNSPFVSKREVDPVDPLSPYAASKLAAEQFCKSFTSGLDFETVILRFFNVFGPRQDPQSEYSAVIPRFVSMILDGERPVIYGDGRQSRDFVYVGDVAKANLLAATVDGIAGRTFNIGRGEQTTLLQLIESLSELLGKTIEPIFEDARVGDVLHSLADINQARRDLHFAPTITIEDGLRRSIEYYRSVAAVQTQ